MNLAEMQYAVTAMGSTDLVTALKPGQFGSSYRTDDDPRPYKLCHGKVIVWPPDDDGDRMIAMHTRLYGLSVARFEATVAMILLKENAKVNQLLFWADDKWRPSREGSK